MCKPKTIIYPFDSDSVHFFRYKDLNISFDIVGAVAPNGWGLTDKDVGTVDGGESIGFTVYNTFDNYYDLFDSVLLVDSYNKLDFDMIIYKNLESLAKNKKNIVCYRALEFEQIQRISQLCGENSVSFKYYEKNQVCKHIYDESIKKINVPVVFVVGMSERTHKFDMQLSLREEISKMGYKISQVGTKNYCETYGFHSFPYFIFSKTMTESEKIVMFNRFIKDIEVDEKPDLIIIGIPGGIMPYNDTFTNGFGIIAYMISQAVKPDAAIFSDFYWDYKEVYFEEIEKMFKYRYGYNIDCFNLSNTKFDIMESEQQNKKCYVLIDLDYIDDKINKYKDMDKPVFNILNSEDRTKMSQYIVDILVGEGIVEEIL